MEEVRGVKKHKQNEGYFLSLGTPAAEGRPWWFLIHFLHKCLAVLPLISAVSVFSLSYKSLSVSFFFVPTLTPEDFPSSFILLTYSSLTLPQLCRSRFSSCRHFFFCHSHAQFSLHWPRVAGIAFQNTAPYLNSLALCILFRK